MPHHAFRAISLGAILACGATAAHAVDESLLFNNMAYEAIECAAFFAIGSGALRNSGETEVSDNAMLAARYAVQWESCSPNGRSSSPKRRRQAEDGH